MESTTPTIESLPSIHLSRAIFGGVVMLIIATADTPRALSQAPAKDAEWFRVTEDELGIKIETDKLEAVIPKKKNRVFAAPGRKAGSQWTQLIVFPRGERFFALMDKVDSVN